MIGLYTSTADEMYKKALEESNPKGKIKKLFSNTDEAVMLFERAYKLYYYDGKYSNALDCQNELLKIATKKNDHKKIYDILYTMGSLNFSLKKDDESLL